MSSAFKNSKEELQHLKGRMKEEALDLMASTYNLLLKLEIESIDITYIVQNLTSI